MSTMEAKKYARKLKKLRASYRKRMWILAIVMLILGLAAGCVVGVKVIAPRTGDAAVPAQTEEAESGLGRTEAEPDRSEPPEDAEPDVSDSEPAEPEVNEAGEDEFEGEEFPEDDFDGEEFPEEDETDDEDVGEDTYSDGEFSGDEPDEGDVEEGEPEEEPETEPEEEPAVEAVPFGTEFTVPLDLNEDGTPYTADSTGPRRTVDCTVSVRRDIDNTYYTETYATSYQLKGNEAGYELTVYLAEDDIVEQVNLQDVLTVMLEGKDGTVVAGYQLTDAEIGGQTESSLKAGSSRLIYKRYNWDGSVELPYLTVTCYTGGSQQKLYFSTEHAADYVPAEFTPVSSVEVSYTIGDENEEIRGMQEKLIALGYLSGDADGIYGSWTAAAVKKAQAALGMEETGVATGKFIRALMEME